MTTDPFLKINPKSALISCDINMQQYCFMLIFNIILSDAPGFSEVIYNVFFWHWVWHLNH